MKYLIENWASCSMPSQRSSQNIFSRTNNNTTDQLNTKLYISHQQENDRKIFIRFNSMKRKI